MDTEEIFKIDVPLKRSGDVLDKWLGAEKLFLPPSSKKKAAALLARCFQNEGIENQTLHYNFLNMISTPQKTDVDDINSVERELQSIIHSAQPKKNLYLVFAAFVVLLCLTVFAFMNQNVGMISKAQEDTLKALVSEVVELEKESGKKISHSALWEEIKRPLGISNYRDLPLSEFENTKTFLEKRLKLVSGQAGEK